MSEIVLQERSLIERKIEFLNSNFDECGKVLDFLDEMEYFYPVSGEHLTFEIKNKDLIIMSSDIFEYTFESENRNNKECIMLLYLLGIINLTADELENFGLDRNLEPFDILKAEREEREAIERRNAPIVHRTLTSEESRERRASFDAKIAAFIGRVRKPKKRTKYSWKIIVALETAEYFTKNIDLIIKEGLTKGEIILKNTDNYTSSQKIDETMARYLCEFGIISPFNLKDICKLEVKPISLIPNATPDPKPIKQIAVSDVTTINEILEKYLTKYDEERGFEILKEMLGKDIILYVEKNILLKLTLTDNDEKFMLTMYESDFIEEKKIRDVFIECRMGEELIELDVVKGILKPRLQDTYVERQAQRQAREQAQRTQQARSRGIIGFLH